MSLLPEMQPIYAVPGLVDKSQSILYTTVRHDATCPTMATNAARWSFPDARLLSVYEMGKLMGHNMGNTDVSEINETNLKQMPGLSLHVGTAGELLCCLRAYHAYAP